MLSNLNHPNVLRFYGVVVESHAEPNVIGIMTEYMKGGSLAAFLRWAFADKCNGKQVNCQLISCLLSLELICANYIMSLLSCFAYQVSVLMTAVLSVLLMTSLLPSLISFV